MKGGKTPVGYTIIEVMIVLAVSGVMFLIAATFISGKQETTSFPQGVNTLASNIQNTIEQVTDGQYSDLNFTCTFAYDGISSQITIGSSAEQTSTNSTANDMQGSESDCIFLGKVMHFSEDDGHGDIDAQQYETFTMAGGRLDNNNQPITADTANPTTPLDNDAPTAVSVSAFTLTTQSVVPEHLNVKDMGLESIASEPSETSDQAFPSSPSPQSFGVGFIENLGSTNQPGTQDGAQPIELYYVKNLSADLDVSSTPAVTNSYINGATLTPVPNGHEIVLCVTDDTQYAYIEIGSASNQLQVRVRMLGDNQCA